MSEDATTSVAPSLAEGDRSSTLTVFEGEKLKEVRSSLAFNRAHFPIGQAQTLRMSYMKKNEPFSPYDFPIQYMPRVKENYRPPVFLLGAGLTFEEFITYAEYKGFTKESVKGNYSWPIRIARDLGRECQLRDYFGNQKHRLVLLHKVWTKSKTSYVLGICTNYNARSEFPAEQCERLLDELEKAGVYADVQWFLMEEWVERDDVDSLDWSEQYPD